MKNSGISLISLVITIVVIIIIVGITLFSDERIPETALYSTFTEEISNVKVALGMVRANSWDDYGDFDRLFKEVKIINAPSEFISFSDAENTGRLIELSILNYENLLVGRGKITGDTVTFGEDDVYVYDKNGTVYYAKGYEEDGIIYYNSTVFKNK